MKISQNQIASMDGDVVLRIDCDNALPTELMKIGRNNEEDEQLTRPLSDRERSEVIYCTLAYGRSPLWYRLMRLLRLSFTKRIYPVQGTPEISLAKEGSNNEPSGKGRKRT